MAIKTERISVRFGPELLEAAEQAAYDQEMSLGEWIRHAVSWYMNQHPTEAQIRAEAERIKQEILGQKEEA